SSSFDGSAGADACDRKATEVMIGCCIDTPVSSVDAGVAAPDSMSSYMVRHAIPQPPFRA
ncbi:hypothetical protein, partial [Bifidobacterium bifidum]